MEYVLIALDIVFDDCDPISRLIKYCFLFSCFAYCVFWFSLVSYVIISTIESILRTVLSLFHLCIMMNVYNLCYLYAIISELMTPKTATTTTTTKRPRERKGEREALIESRLIGEQYMRLKLQYFLKPKQQYVPIDVETANPTTKPLYVKNAELIRDMGFDIEIKEGVYYLRFIHCAT